MHSSQNLMRFFKKIHALIFLVFGVSSVICGLIPYHINTTGFPASGILQIDINSTINHQTASSIDMSFDIPEKAIFQNVNVYRKLFKPYDYTQSIPELQTTYKKLEEILETVKVISSFSKIDETGGVYISMPPYIRKIRSYAFAIIGTVSLNSKHIILNEMGRVQGERSDSNFPYNALGVTREDIKKIIINEIKDSVLIEQQLNNVIKVLKKALCEPVEYKEYIDSLAYGFNLLNIVNFVRVNRILDVLYIQKMLQFEKNAVNQMDGYKKARRIKLNMLNKKMSKKRRAQDIFKHTLTSPETFLSSVSDVKFKKTIIYSACTQILNLIPSFLKEINLLDIKPEKKEVLQTNFRMTYEYGIKALNQLKVVDSYNFDNNQLTQIEVEFSMCVQEYLNAAELISEYINDLQKNIETLLFNSVKPRKRTPDIANNLSKMLQLDKYQHIDVKKIFLIKSIISLLSIERDLCYKKKNSLYTISYSIGSDNSEYPPISYNMYTKKASKNNKMINKVIKRYEKKLDMLYA
ncbi:hypothetical protein NEPAR05_0616 [Nematocida parisii]|nr:hypothetical protein NEPAR07_0787 [Nematocida parisii]KAI5156486.1 hypothetical protein NEPAR05_0616 [Nematocida parisii]